MRNLESKNKGFGLIELLIVAAIIGITLAALAGFGNYLLKINGKIKQQMIAVYLAQEGIEAARAVGDENWSLITALTPSNPYHPAKSGGKWVLSAGTENVNNYTRQVVVENVNRDANDDIAAVGGVLDVGTKKIITTISWSDRGQNYQTALAAYLTNWKP